MGIKITKPEEKNIAIQNGKVMLGSCPTLDEQVDTATVQQVVDAIEAADKTDGVIDEVCPVLTPLVTPDNDTPTSGDLVTLSLSGADSYSLKLGTDFEEEELQRVDGISTTKRYYFTGTKDIEVMGTNSETGKKVTYPSLITVGPTPNVAAIDAISSLPVAEINRGCLWEAKIKEWELWNNIVFCFIFLGDTEATQKCNLKNPTDSDAAHRLTTFGSPTRATGKVTGGAGIYMRTHATPDAHFNDFSFSMFCYLFGSHTNTQVPMGCYASTNSITQINTTAGNSACLHGSLGNVVSPNLADVNPDGGMCGITVESNSSRKAIFDEQIRNISTGVQGTFINPYDVWLLDRNTAGSGGLSCNVPFGMALALNQSVTSEQVRKLSDLCKSNKELLV